MGCFGLVVGRVQLFRNAAGVDGEFDCAFVVAEDCGLCEGRVDGSVGAGALPAGQPAVGGEGVEVAVEDEHFTEVLTEYPVFEKVVQVKSSFFHSLSKSYLLMAVTIVIAVAVVGWILIKKLRLG